VEAFYAEAGVGGGCLGVFRVVQELGEEFGGECGVAARGGAHARVGVGELGDGRLGQRGVGGGQGADLGVLMVEEVGQAGVGQAGVAQQVRELAAGGDVGVEQEAGWG
jgi:hypothetical protein